MRYLELLILLALIAVAMGWASLHARSPGEVPTPSATGSAAPEELTGAGPGEGEVWTVNGISVKDRPADLEERFGKPTRIKKDPDVDQYWFATPMGAAHLSYFREGSVGVAGEQLQRQGKTVVKTGDSEKQVREGLGVPSRVENGEDFRALQYPGARVYLRNDQAFGVVTEGQGR